MAKYLLIGGAGVFAVHFPKYLLSRNDTKGVISVGRNPPAAPPFTLGVGDNDDRFSYHQIHFVFEQDRLLELIDSEQPEYIINFAALAYATSWHRSHRYYDTNVVSVAKLCEALQTRSFLKRFIQIGTSELYGSVDHPVDEEGEIRPTSPYAVSKLAADLHLETLWKVQEFPMNIIRPSNAYGPGQLMYRILPRAVYCALHGEKLPLQGGGAVKKSYMHAGDLAKAIHLVCHNGRMGETYNVGPDEPVSIRYLVELVAKSANVSFDTLVEMVPGRVGEDAQYWLDSSKIKKDVNWTEEISLEEGIDDMVDWGKKYIETMPAPSNFILRA